jgi:hypothetical protein
MLQQSSQGRLDFGLRKFCTETYVPAASKTQMRIVGTMNVEMIRAFKVSIV